MIRILFGPFLITSIVSPQNYTTPAAPSNRTLSRAALNISSNTSSSTLNATTNQTRLPSSKWDPANSSVGKYILRANTYIKYPYIVSINKETEDHSLTHYCSGSILTVSVVLTACQCVGNVYSDGVDRYQADTLLIIAGTSKATENSTEKQDILVKSLESHSKCRRVGHLVEYDLGLVFLGTEVKLRQGVATVPVGNFGVRSLMDEYSFIKKFKVACYSPGWAYMRRRTEDQLVIDTVDNPVWIISDEECRRSHCLGGRKNSCTARFELRGQVCAMPYNKSTPCHADVGGPLICDKHLYGVISSSESCSPRLPQIYVSPNVVFQFIEKFVPFYTTAYNHLGAISVSSKIQQYTFQLWSVSIISLTLV